SEKEIAAYADLFSEAALRQRDFLAGAKVTIEAMLQSPSFLFHLEDGPGGQSRQFGVASRLSYFLWDTMPGPELLHAAEAGELGTADEIRKVAHRMLDDPRAKRALEVFLAQWMRFDRVMTAVRGRAYPDFSASLLPLMTEETKRLFNHLVWDDGNFM